MAPDGVASHSYVSVAPMLLGPEIAATMYAYGLRVLATSDAIYPHVLK